MNLPRHGAIIVFSQVPAGSWARVGTRYRVDHPKPGQSVRVVNVETGSSTYDRPAMYRAARWEEVEPSPVLHRVRVTHHLGTDCQLYQRPQDAAAAVRFYEGSGMTCEIDEIPHP